MHAYVFVSVVYVCGVYTCLCMQVCVPVTVPQRPEEDVGCPTLAPSLLLPWDRCGIRNPQKSFCLLYPHTTMLQLPGQVVVTLTWVLVILGWAQILNICICIARTLTWWAISPTWHLLYLKKIIYKPSSSLNFSNNILTEFIELWLWPISLRNVFSLILELCNYLLNYLRCLMIIVVSSTQRKFPVLRTL